MKSFATEEMLDAIDRTKPSKVFVDGTSVRIGYRTPEDTATAYSILARMFNKIARVETMNQYWILISSFEYDYNHYEEMY